MWRHWLRQLGDRHSFVRYDERGCGLSDTNIGDPSVNVWVGDLETVIDAVGLERFALLGISQAAAIAVAYAARYPDRVSHLVLYGGYARGRRFRGQDTEEEAIVAAILASTSVPVLVTHGRDDVIVLPSMAEHTLAACPAATASWYDGVGHMPFWEASDRFDHELADLARAAVSV